MAIQISIIGLDRAGLSLGMALKNSKNPVTRTGFDLDSGAVKTAEKTGAVDKTALNLLSAVEKADVILLNLTGGEVLEYARNIAGNLKDGATLVNLAPVHKAVCEWSKNQLPAGRSLINATAVLAGGMLGSDEVSVDLFRGSIMLITTPAGTNASAIQLVVDLAELLGAAPLFSDPIEADGLLSMTDLFPRIVTSLYLQTTLNQPGWVEAGKVAGPAFWHMTKPAEHFIAGKFVAHEILLQKDNVLRYLNLLQDEVQSLQDSIESGDEESIAKMLQQTVDEQARWMTNRISGRWEKASPDFQKAPASGWKKLLGMEAPDKKRKA